MEEKIKKTVLVVDDDPSFLSSIKRDLSRFEYNVLTAETVKAALDIHDKQSVDVSVVDLFMPDKDGLELIMELKKRFSDPLIIAITGGVSDRYPLPNMLASANALGAQHTLEKPFDVPVLAEKIKELIIEKLFRSK